MTLNEDLHMEVENHPVIETNDDLAVASTVNAGECGRGRPRSRARRWAYALATLALATVSLVSPSCQQSDKKPDSEAAAVPVISATTAPAGDAAAAGPTL